MSNPHYKHRLSDKELAAFDVKNTRSRMTPLERAQQAVCDQWHDRTQSCFDDDAHLDRHFDDDAEVALTAALDHDEIARVLVEANLENQVAYRTTSTLNRWDIQLADAVIAHLLGETKP